MRGWVYLYLSNTCRTYNPEDVFDSIITTNYTECYASIKLFNYIYFTAPFLSVPTKTDPDRIALNAHKLIFVSILSSFAYHLRRHLFQAENSLFYSWHGLQVPTPRAILDTGFDRPT